LASSSLPATEVEGREHRADAHGLVDVFAASELDHGHLDVSLERRIGTTRVHAGMRRDEQRERRAARMAEVAKPAEHGEPGHYHHDAQLLELADEVM
jgi:hypothetical protein